MALPWPFYGERDGQIIPEAAIQINR